MTKGIFKTTDGAHHATTRAKGFESYSKEINKAIGNVGKANDTRSGAGLIYEGTKK